MSRGRLLGWPLWWLSFAAANCTNSVDEQVSGLSQADGSGPATETGSALPVEIHRMTRLQYNNTVRDLLHTTLTPADNFPSDPAIEGYDNVASSLTLSPQLASLYHQAAKALALDATSPKARWGVSISGPKVGPTASPDGSPLSNWGWQIRSPFVFSVQVPMDDTAQLTIIAGGAATHAPTPLMAVAVDGKPLQTFTVTATTALPAAYAVTLPISRGSHKVAVTFTNKVTDNATTSNTDSELAIGQITLASQTQAPSPGLATLMVCDPDTAADAEACWRNIATTFVERAWRRPLSTEETGRVGSLWQALLTQSSHELALQSLVQAALISPNFLYLAGRPAADSGEPTRSLDDYDLASRLSYFLWNSMPDQELLAAAGAGSLRARDGLAAQVDRMIADEKIQGLLDGFAAQWLQTRGLDTATPDAATFPGWNSDLKAAMRTETQLFFADYLSNGQPIASMLTPDFAFVNDMLAQHYGLSLPGSTTIARVSVPSSGRRGLLGLGAWLTANSVQTRTSPVKRGRFIMQNLLCRTIAPPPPGIAPLPTTMTGPQVTQRQLLDEHTKSAVCAGCHSVIDPPGFAVEVYDGIGAPRDHEGRLAIDATGSLNGTSFNGAMQLAAIVAQDKSFVGCVAQQIYGYALSRTVGDEDAPALADIVEHTAQAGDRLDALVRQVVLSPQFTQAPAS